MSYSRLEEAARRHAFQRKTAPLSPMSLQKFSTDKRRSLPEPCKNISDAVCLSADCTTIGLISAVLENAILGEMCNLMLFRWSGERFARHLLVLSNNRDE